MAQGKQDEPAEEHTAPTNAPKATRDRLDFLAAAEFARASTQRDMAARAAREQYRNR